MAAATSQVIEDDDMLGEILLRLVFPTSLVRAALVCRRWLRVASNPVFLRRFLDLHPPRLLGFYTKSAEPFGTPRFVPTPCPPAELAAAVRLAGSAVHEHMPWSIFDCRNGRLLIQYKYNRRITVVLSPLHPARYMVTLPLLPITTPFRTMWLNTDGVPFATSWDLGHQPKGAIIHFHELRDGTWCNLTSPAMRLPSPLLPVSLSRRIDGKLYLFLSSASNAATLDSNLSELPYVSIIALPDGLEDGNVRPWIDDSGVYLIHVKDLQLHVWVYRLDTENWLLQDTVCLQEACAKSGVTELASQSQHGLRDTIAVRIHEVGHSYEFMFLQVGLDVLYVHIKSKTVEKVYTATPEEYGSWVNLIPFVMVWPPIFPVIKEYSTQYK